ncbi:hypothetical protein HMPREF1536_05157 [Parabacteroides gordonii MS-1 = DSM 23371]|uniref:Uncharacterized protein n=1 Tax=Parabacteroides gordonii MS-1 = DSM 23371 TaxID=1203610 RepID=A0A0F5IPV1_9BACT|nr:hypothetical protein HMPREF1536_05157 [Parabacteroides gordonii MS-1 = DSM 23371]
MPLTDKVTEKIYKQKKYKTVFFFRGKYDPSQEGRLTILTPYNNYN